MSDDVPSPIDLTDIDDEWVPADTFGARLALIRQRLGLNVTEAAKLCGLPQASWHTWENGVEPRKLFDVARKISEATRVRYDWLLLGGQLAPIDAAGPSPIRSRCSSPGAIRPIPGQSEIEFPRPDLPAPILAQLLARTDTMITLDDDGTARIEYAMASGY